MGQGHYLSKDKGIFKIFDSEFTYAIKLYMSPEEGRRDNIDEQLFDDIVLLIFKVFGNEKVMWVSDYIKDPVLNLEQLVNQTLEPFPLLSFLDLMCSLSKEWQLQMLEESYFAVLGTNSETLVREIQKSRLIYEMIINK